MALKEKGLGPPGLRSWISCVCLHGVVAASVQQGALLTSEWWHERLQSGLMLSVAALRSCATSQTTAEWDWRNTKTSRDFSEVRIFQLFPLKVNLRSGLTSCTDDELSWRRELPTLCRYVCVYMPQRARAKRGKVRNSLHMAPCMWLFILPMMLGLTKPQLMWVIPQHYFIFSMVTAVLSSLWWNNVTVICLNERPYCNTSCWSNSIIFTAFIVIHAM